MLTVQEFKKLVESTPEGKVQICWDISDESPIVQDFERDQIHQINLHALNDLLVDELIKPHPDNKSSMIKIWLPVQPPASPINLVFNSVPTFIQVIDLFDIAHYDMDIMRWNAETNGWIKLGQQVSYRLIEHGYNEEHNTPQLTFECKAFNSDNSEFLDNLPKGWHATI